MYRALCCVFAVFVIVCWTTTASYFYHVSATWYIYAHLHLMMWTKCGGRFFKYTNTTRYKYNESNLTLHQQRTTRSTSILYVVFLYLDCLFDYLYRGLCRSNSLRIYVLLIQHNAITQQSPIKHNNMYVNKYRLAYFLEMHSIINAVWISML